MTTNPIDTAAAPAAATTTATTTATTPTASGPLPPRRAALALATMFLGSFSLVTAEFLPPGVLTPVAQDLGVTEGVVGLSVSEIGRAHV